jgi:tetratricopeptide (TPR) repeat protein
MQRSIFLLVIYLCLAVPGLGQSQSGDKDPYKNQPPPRSDRDKEAGESSSRDTRIDLTPPPNDAKDHPNSTVPDADNGPDNGEDNSAGVQEFHPYDPHRAAKDIEVGDFYFKKKNYHAALDRYREALFYKPNDAVANFRMAQSFEKLSQPDEAIQHYQEYLKILPNGPLSEEAKKELEKAKSKVNQASGKDQAQQ